MITRSTGMRLMSLMLTLVMLFTMSPAALAADGDGAAKQEITELTVSIPFADGQALPRGPYTAEDGSYTYTVSIRQALNHSVKGLFFCDESRGEGVRFWDKNS